MMNIHNEVELSDHDSPDVMSHLVLFSNHVSGPQADRIRC